MPNTIVEWLVAGSFVLIGLTALAGTVAVSVGLYYLVTSPAVTSWLGY